MVRLCPICRMIKWGFPIKCDCGYREVKRVISIEKYFEKCPTADGELRANAMKLLIKINSLLQDMGIKEATLTSGYRDPVHNAAVGGAPNSKHCLAQAIDLADNDRKIGNRLMLELFRLESRGLAMENLLYCERANGNKWVHLQDGLPKSGRTVFVPYAGPPRKT